MSAHTALIASTLMFAGLVSGGANATLIDRGRGLIYDNALDITWLQNANYAKTNGYDADGRMSWDNAKAWAAGLSYGGYTDWRLPTMPGCGATNADTNGFFNVQTICGTTAYNSEMAYMYYVNLGLKGAYIGRLGSHDAHPEAPRNWGIFGNGTLNGTDNSSYGQNDVGLIDNLQSFAYWSGLALATDPVGAWFFNQKEGSQYTTFKRAEFYAWAVRPGDVAGVPEPATWLLFGLGIVVLGAMKTRSPVLH